MRTWLPPQRYVADIVSRCSEIRLALCQSEADYAAESEPIQLEFLERVSQLRRRFFKIVGEQRGSGEVFRLSTIVPLMSRGLCLPPFLFREVAAAQPSQSDDFVAFIVVERFNRPDELLIGRIGPRLIEDRLDPLILAVRFFILIDRSGLGIELARLLDDEGQFFDGDGQHGTLHQGYRQRDMGSTASAFVFWTSSSFP